MHNLKERLYNRADVTRLLVKAIEAAKPGTPANNDQIGGDHYKIGGEEHWDRVKRLGLDYFQGCITKYVERWKKKGGIADLEKASHYLRKYIEVIQLEGLQSIPLIERAAALLMELDREQEELRKSDLPNYGHPDEKPPQEARGQYEDRGGGDGVHYMDQDVVDSMTARALRDQEATSTARAWREAEATVLLGHIVVGIEDSTANDDAVALSRISIEHRRAAWFVMHSRVALSGLGLSRNDWHAVSFNIRRAADGWDVQGFKVTPGPSLSDLLREGPGGNG